MLTRLCRLLREADNLRLDMQIARGRLEHTLASLADDEPELLEMELDLVEAEVLALRRELARWSRVGDTLTALRHASDQKKQALWDSLRRERRDSARLAAAVSNAELLADADVERVDVYGKGSMPRGATIRRTRPC